MDSEFIVRFVVQRPFVPFEIFTADGRVLKAPHPEFVTLERHTVAMTFTDTNGNVEIVDSALIVSVRTLQPARQ
jgi:hypothetical protein